MYNNDIRLEDFTIPTLGEPQFDSPLNPSRLLFTNEADRILYYSHQAPAGRLPEGRQAPALV